MSTVPTSIKLVFDELRKKEKLHFVLKKINGKYYVYAQSTMREPSTKKVKTISTYFGRITEDGALLKKHAGKDIELENAKAIIEAHGGSVSLPSTTEQREQFLSEDQLDAKLLRMLSMNARIEQKEMAKRVELKEGALRNRIADVEARYGIRYTAEIDTSKLGYRSYFVFAKFDDEKPSKEALKSAIEREGRVQFAALTTGIYDLIIYLLAESDAEISNTIGRIRANYSINEFSSEWFATPLYEVYGFVPLRALFFDVLKERVWHRTKGRSTTKPDEIFQREFILLKELNANGVEPFLTIDKKYQLGKGGARYTYLSLKEKGIVKRITVTYTKPPSKFNAIFILDIVIRKNFDKTRANLMHFTIEDRYNFINKISFAADIKIPNGVLYVAPIIEEDDFVSFEEDIKNRISGIKLTSLIITDVFIGELNTRRFDTVHSTQYDHLISYYKEKLPQNKEYYE